MLRGVTLEDRLILNENLCSPIVHKVLSHCGVHCGGGAHRGLSRLKVVL